MQVQAELAGIPQHGLVLGSRSAAVAITEYADLTCAPCASASTDILPPLIAQYVRAGTVSVTFAPVVEGPLSDQLALGAYSAGLQDAAWDYVQLAYLRSTPTSNGPLDAPGDLIGALGLQASTWQADLYRPRWAAAIEQSASVAAIGGFTSYPVFIVHARGRRRARAHSTILTSPVTLAALTHAIATALPASSRR